MPCRTHRESPTTFLVFLSHVTKVLVSIQKKRKLRHSYHVNTFRRILSKLPIDNRNITLMGHRHIIPLFPHFVPPFLDSVVYRLPVLLAMTHLHYC